MICYIGWLFGFVETFENYHNFLSLKSGRVSSMKLFTYFMLQELYRQEVIT